MRFRPYKVGQEESAVVYGERHEGGVWWWRKIRWSCNEYFGGFVERMGSSSQCFCGKFTKRRMRSNGNVAAL